MSVISNSALAGSSGQGGGSGYAIERSLRFDSGDSPYLSRSAIDSGSSVYKYTVSWWMKIGSIGTDKTIVSFATNNAVNGWTKIHLRTDNTLAIFGDSPGTALSVRPSMVFRDPSAWYHCCVSIDTTQSVYSDQIKFTINGVEQTDFAGTAPFAQNTVLSIGEATTHHIGAEPNSVGTLRNYFDGYLADMQVIEGQALAASDFGQYDSNSVWQPKEFAGTYATPGTTGNSGPWNSGFSSGSVSSGDTHSTNGNLNALSIDTESLGAHDITITKTSGADDIYLVTSATNSNYTLVANNQTTVRITNTGTPSHSLSRWVQIKGSGTGNVTVTITGTANGTLATGANSFHLDFSDNSSKAALGTDTSGNSNTWTVNNLNAAGLDMDQSQTWSTYGSPSSGGFALAASRGFNGNTANQTEGNTTGAYFSIPYSATVAVGGVGFFTYASGSSGKMQVYNGATLVETVDSSTGGSWRYTSSYSGAITEIRISRDSRAFEFSAVSVNGKVLVDAGVPDPLGANIDALRDSPVNGNSANDTGAGGEITGNYATFNPLQIKANLGTMENGNLTLKASGSYYIEGKSTQEIFSYDNYCELTISGGDSNTDGGFGIGDHDAWVAGGAGSYITYRENGAIISYPGNTTVATVSGYTAGDVLGMAVDTTNIKFYKNGSLQGTYAHGKSGTFFAHVMNLASNSNAVMDINFGARPFAYTAPSGYKALCTANLPDPTIADGSTAFDTKLYTGNDNTQTISGMSLSPSLLWLKSRAQATNHEMFDVVRGSNKILFPNLTNAETTDSNRVTSFNSDGFGLGANSNANVSGGAVAWAWDAGSSTVTNTDGSISSQVRANPSAGFSIVSYTGTGSAATVGHGLNAAPEMIILKDRNAVAKWKVLHVGAVSGTDPYYQNVLHLNTTEAFTGTGNSYPWGGTAPTSSVFSVANVGTEANRSGSINNTNYIAYCFSPVEQYSSFGSYLGNGSADGPFVFTGLRPAFVLIKSTGSGNWYLYDTTREEYNLTVARLYPNLTNAEDTGTANTIDIVSNGFKLRNSHAGINASGSTFIYAAFAEHPFKNSRAR